MNDTVKKWMPTGLLEGLQESQYEEAAEYLNQTALKLVADYPKKDSPKEAYERSERIAGMVIPLARIMFEKYSNRPDAKVLVEDFTRFYDEKLPLLRDLTETSYSGLDGEMEFVSCYKFDVDRGERFKEEKWTPNS